jgi:hypothetical protein
MQHEMGYALSRVPANPFAAESMTMGVNGSSSSQLSALFRRLKKTVGLEMDLPLTISQLE